MISVTGTILASKAQSIRMSFETKDPFTKRYCLTTDFVKKN